METPPDSRAPRQGASAGVETRARAMRLRTLIGLGLFVTTMAQTQALGRLPLQFLLKSRLHVEPEAMAAFFAITALPWDLKPLAGLLSDSVPLFGTRRRHYLLLGSLLAAVIWLLVGFGPRTLGALILLATLLNVGMVMASTVSGGLLVETPAEKSKRVEGNDGLPVGPILRTQKAGAVHPMAETAASATGAWDCLSRGDALSRASRPSRHPTRARRPK